MRWWGDNWEWASGTLIALVGILISVLIAVWQRRPKLLDYELATSVPILSTAHGDMHDKLSVSFENVKLNDPWLVLVRVVNSGKQAILKDDYDMPVEVRVENDVLIDGFLSGVSDPHIDVTLIGLDYDETETQRHHRKLYIQPGLLNPEEGFDVQLICDGSPGAITVWTRFADQSRPMRNRRWHVSWYREATWWIALMWSVIPIGSIILGAPLWVIIATLVGTLFFASIPTYFTYQRRALRKRDAKATAGT